MFASRANIRKLRRLRRSIERTSAMPPPKGSWDFDSMLGSLCGWASSLPWVQEVPGSESGTLRLFMIECSFVSLLEPWFALKERGDELAEPSLFVVMPETLARRALASGWAMELEQVSRCRAVTVLELPTCPGEFQALQRVLEASYSWAFESAQ